MRAILFAAAAALGLGGCERATQVGNQSEPAAEAAAGSSIAEALGRSADHRQFITAVRAAGLEPALAGPVPYTVLAPSNAAFDKLPAAARDSLTKPEGRPRLIAILAIHVLPGTLLVDDIAKAIERGGGKASLATTGRATLTATRDGEAIVLTDPAGGKARLTRTDQKHRNGVVHAIDTVLTPA